MPLTFVATNATLAIQTKPAAKNSRKPSATKKPPAFRRLLPTHGLRSRLFRNSAHRKIHPADAPFNPFEAFL
jgi:hypothetical protein